jgi:phage terminase large subunit-like protein
LHGSIEASRLRSAPEMTRVVVAIDPAVTSGEQADETGIVVAGKDKNGHGYVLADISGRYPPIEWARLAITAYRTHRADRIVAEVNNGGDMVGATLRMVDPNVAFTAVRASRGNGGAGRTGGGALPAGPRPSHRHLPATRRPDDKFYIGYRPRRSGVFAGPR